MVMRVAGLATGMDIEAMVDKLMEAERMPLTRMEQERTLLTWKRDAFRDINRALLSFNEMMLDMKLSPTYQTKKVISSQSSAVTATASTSASDGAYRIRVDQLASSEMNIGQKIDSVDDSVNLEAGILHFHTFNESGEAVNHEIQIDEGDTVKDVLKKISDQNNNVRAFYDTGSQRVVLEMTRTGKYNSDGMEVGFGRYGETEAEDVDSINFFTNE